MKIFYSTFLLVICLAMCGCVTNKVCDHSDFAKIKTVSPNLFVKLLHITANVDGTGRIIFTARDVHYENKNWSPPTQVTINDVPWDNLDQTPSGWHAFSKGLDLTKARIVKREGRDIIALEQTVKGFDLYLCDSPNGSADYEVIIAIPRKK
jgi:hypothetical protein